jgi:GNAT superfamily N-acetyltransferase
MSDIRNDISGTLMEISFRKASAVEMPIVLQLLKEAALWLRTKKIDYWQNWIDPAPNFVNWIQRGFDDDEFFLVETVGRTAGCFRLQWQDPMFWGPQPDDAGYMHSFTVRRDLAGNGLGYRLLDMITDYCDARAKMWLRLDCGADVPGLRKYYENYGFRWVKDMVYAGFPTTLYEKPIRRSVVR